MPKSDLPFGSEFSPSQIALARVLELAHQHGGDWNAFEHAVKVEYFGAHKTSDYNRRKLANNCKLGMIAYGIIDRDARLTDFGSKLYALRDDAAALHTKLARQILLNLNGANLVQCVQDMQAAGETVELTALRDWMNERGIHFPRGGKHPSIMRLWLEKGGVFVDGWRVDQDRLRAIMGISSDDMDALAVLSPEQRAYLKTLVNMGGPGPYSSNEVEKLAAATYGVRFNEKNLPKAVLYPLETAGYVALVRGTKEAGRGAKPFLVTPTAKLVSEVVGPLLDQLEKLTAADLRPLLRKPLAEIIKELPSTDRHVAGLALEALAFKLMRLIDLSYVATRLRGTATGGAEVDLIFESARLVFARWQVQCKNSDRVSLDDVAKEVGLTHMLKSSVIVIVSTGQIGNEARKYANVVSDVKPLHFVFLDRNDLAMIAMHPGALVQRIADQAPIALCRNDEFSFLLERAPHAGIAPISVE
jgi:site-specific DNA-methyltransferase (cytosine-N4-specific)